MTRLILLAAAMLLVVSFLLRAPRLRRVLWALMLAIAAYSVLKATGVIEAAAPDRIGVF